MSFGLSALGVAAVSAVAVGGIASSVAGNAAIDSSSKAAYAASMKRLGQERGIKTANLAYQAEEINNQIGAQLTQLFFEQSKAEATITTSQVERNVYGQTAQRNHRQAAMEASLTADNIVQQGETALMDLQTEQSDAKYSYDSGSFDAAANFANSMSQKKSGLDIGLGAVSSVVGGISAAKSLGGSLVKPA